MHPCARALRPRGSRRAAPLGMRGVFGFWRMRAGRCEPALLRRSARLRDFSASCQFVDRLRVPLRMQLRALLALCMIWGIYFILAPCASRYPLGSACAHSSHMRPQPRPNLRGGCCCAFLWMSRRARPLTFHSWELQDTWREPHTDFGRSLVRAVSEGAQLLMRLELKRASQRRRSRTMESLCTRHLTG